MKIENFEKGETDAFVVCVVCLVAGLCGGVFFAFPVLVGISILCFVIGIWLCVTCKEAEQLVSMLFVGIATIINVVMWMTYYITTGQTWLGDFFLRR